MKECSIDLQELDGPRLVRREELAASRRLAALCFPGFVEEAGEGEQVASYTPPRRGGVQVLCHRGAPVSQIGITHSRVNVCGSHLRVASIGGVCTHPDYRGLGLATRLLDYCMRKLTAGGARLVLISGMRRLYTRAGCVTAQDLGYIVLKSDDLRTRISGINGLKVRLATEADVLLCARLYQMEAVHFVRRAEEFTQHFCQLEEFPRAEDWIVEVTGQPAAYLFTGIPWEYRREKDAGVREVLEYAGSRVALVGGLAEVMACLGLRELRLPVPWQDVDFFQLLRAQGATGEHVPLPWHTMRIVNFPGLMSGLRLYVRARLTARQRRGLRFEQEGDRYGIVRGQERLELDGAAMTRLVMGIPAEMAPDTVVGPGALGEIVPALFPLPSFLPGLNYQ